jgi:hypothetical protein
MPRRHITCQWNGQAARLIRNKCRGRAAQRPYVRLRPLAYVTGGRPRGSIGAPPERGAEAYTVWSGHVSAPDPRLALIKARVFLAPESWDPAMGGLDPTQRGPEPILGVRFAPVEVLDLAWRSSLYMQGSGTFPWGSGPTVDTLEDIVFSGHMASLEPSTWRGRVLFTTRLEIAARAPRLHTVVRGTPVSGYRHSQSPYPLCWRGGLPSSTSTAADAVSASVALRASSTRASISASMYPCSSSASLSTSSRSSTCRFRSCSMMSLFGFRIPPGAEGEQEEGEGQGLARNLLAWTCPVVPDPRGVYSPILLYMPESVGRAVGPAVKTSWLRNPSSGFGSASNESSDRARAHPSCLFEWPPQLGPPENPVSLGRLRLWAYRRRLRSAHLPFASFSSRDVQTGCPVRA